MKANRRRDTQPELRVRRNLHALGMRFLVDAPVPGTSRRRRADVLLRGARVAVYVDGCFWHSLTDTRSVTVAAECAEGDIPVNGFWTANGSPGPGNPAVFYSVGETGETATGYQVRVGRSTLNTGPDPGHRRHGALPPHRLTRERKSPVGRAGRPEEVEHLPRLAGNSRTRA